MGGGVAERGIATTYQDIRAAQGNGTTTIQSGTFSTTSAFDWKLKDRINLARVSAIFYAQWARAVRNEVFHLNFSAHFWTWEFFK